MTPATRRHVGPKVSKSSESGGPRTRERGLAGRSRPFAALCALAIVLGLTLQLGSITTASAAPAPVGNGFVVTPGDLAFILKQIRIAEMHSTTLTASDPCGTMLAQPGDGIPDEFQVPDVITSFGLRTVDGSCNNLKAATGVQAPGQPSGPFAGTANPSFFGAANQVFPRLTTPYFRDADLLDPSFPVGPPGPTSYKSKTGSVIDSEVRVTSNLIDDQTNTNPAAVAAAGHPQRTQTGGKATAVPCTTDPQPDAVPPVDGVPLGCTPSHQTLFIPNVTTDTGLSPPYNSLFTFFGQFFDHGIDQTEKSGGTVFITLNADDPLRTVGPDGIAGTNCGTPQAAHCDEVPASQAFMALPRTQDQPGPDGILHTADDIQDASNTDTPWVDQSQTYTSHASHQVFLREYQPGTGTAGTNNPAAVSDGMLLQGIVNDDPLPCTKPAGFACYNDGQAGAGSESTWAAVRKQAHDLFGMRLADKDVLNVPLLATDPYGKYLPGSHGLPQYVTKGPDGKAGTPDDVLVEGRLDNPATPAVDETIAVPSDVEYFGTPFLTDIAHNADPSPDPQSGVSPTPDPDSTTLADFSKQTPGTYDDELLADHFACGDGRCNENIALSSIHQVFHSEHDRLVSYIDNVLTTDTSPGAASRLADWKAKGVQGANGTGGYTYGERLFQAARFVTEMEYQHLVFEEFARKVQPAVRPFHVYSPDINPAIDAEFAHAVYRFGHSMLDDQVARQDANADGSRTDNSLPLLKAFLNPPEFFKNSVDPAHPVYTPEQAAGSVLLGSSDQTGNEIDEFVTETLRNNLLGLPLDLPSLNMARARDAGVPSLNETRRQLFAQTNDGQLAPYTSWSDFGQHMKHAESLINFVAAYGTHPSIQSVSTIAGKRAAARAIVDPQPGDVQPADAADFMFSTGAWASTPSGVTTTGLDVDPITNPADPRFVNDADQTTGVDLWVGGLAELTNQNGGMLGSTFNYVFQTQLEKLQDGDRLYYLARTPGMNLRTQLEGNSFSELIERNTDYTNTLKADAFSTADCKFQLADITSPYSTSAPSAVPGFPPGTTLSMTRPAPDTLTALTGLGTVNDDPITACDENQLLLRKPDGTIQYRANNNIDPSGINGQSVYNGKDDPASPDRITGGVDNDTIWGNKGNDVIEGNNGDDIALGGDGNDIITDLNGADVPKGGPGNDAIDGGPGDDIPMGNAGDDFINGGANDNESFAGPGNDHIIAGQGADTVFGDGGDDWLEGGTGQDLLQGDHGAPFFDDPAEKAPGNDIFVGQPGENDYDAEGGDDIMAQNAAIDRNAGAGGFDWAIHQYDTVGGDDDLEINQQLAGLPLPVVVNRDRWQETEADSGSNFNDTIRGDALERIVGGFGFTGCDALDPAGVARIKGLGGYVTTFPTSLADVKAVAAAGDCPLTGAPQAPGNPITGDPSQGGVWAEGNILFGGGGSDVIEGRENQDIIDGDNALHVAITVRTNPSDPSTEIGRTDLMENQATSGNFGPGTAGMTLQQAVFAGLVDPGNLVNVREIVQPDNSAIGASPDRAQAGDCPAPTPDPSGGSTVKLTASVTNCDTAVFSEEPAAGPSGFDITPNANGSVTVTDIASAALIAAGTPFPKGDGIDTLWNIENLRFCTGIDPVTKKCIAFQDVPIGAPAAPLNVTALALNGGALVSWTEPAAAAAITSFDVRVFANGNLVKTVTVPPTDTSAIITGLDNGTAFTFKVRANGKGGHGADSETSAPVTPQGPQVTAPGAPSIGTASAAVGGASISWTAPTTDGGDAITSYQVDVLDGSDAVIKTVTVAAPATSVMVSGLTPGTTVRFRVSAINGAGTSVSSTTSNAVTVIGDVVAPTVSGRTPRPGAHHVARGAHVVVTFSERVSAVNARTFTLTNLANHKVVKATVTLSADGRTATLKPAARLAAGHHFRVQLTNGVRDMSANRLAATTWNFTT